MSETNVASKSAPGKRRLWLWVVGGLGVVAVGGYLTATSSFFLKSFVLPRVGQALGSQVTAESLSASPLSGSLAVRGFGLQPLGAERLVAVQDLQARFSLWSILGGRYDVSELKVTGPVVTLVEGADGQSNLDALLKAMAQGKDKSTPTSGAGGPLQLSLRQLVVQQGTIRYVKKSAQGEDVAEIEGLNLTVDRVQNGQPAKLDLSAQLKYELKRSTNAGAASLLAAKLSANYTAGLAADLQPQSLAGTARLDVTQAQGAWAEAAALAGGIECSVTPTSIDKLSLRFEKAGKTLGQLNVSGPFDPAKKEGRLRLELVAVDRQVLNLAGAAAGLDFGQTTLNATNTVDLSQKGNIVALNGHWTGSQVTLRQGTRTTPALDLDLDCQLNVDLLAQSLRLQQLTFESRAAGRPFLSARLDQTMNLDWGKTQAGFKEASLGLTLTNLNLTEWGFLLGSNAPSGVAGLVGKVTAQQDGKLLSLDLEASLRDLALRVGTNRLTYGSVVGRVRSRVQEYRVYTIDSYTVEARDTGVATLALNGSGEYSTVGGDVSLRAMATADVPTLLAKYPVPGMQCATGVAKVNLLYSSKPSQQQQVVSGSLALSDFVGACSGFSLRNYSALIDSELELKAEAMRLNRFTLAAKDSYNSGGTCTLSGAYDTARQTAQFSFNTVDLNQYALSPFLTPFLAPMQLTRCSITSKGNGTYDPKGKSALNADVKIAGLTVVDPSGKLPSAPLDFQVRVDAGLSGTNDLRLSQLLLDLGDEQKGRAGGSVGLSGTVDLASLQAKLNYGLTNLNENGLAAWLEPLLAPRKLASLRFDGAGSIQYSPTGDSQCVGEWNVSRLLLTQGGTTNTAVPTAAQLKLDASMKAQAIELRQALLALTPTALASNQLTLTGRVDMAKSNAIAGQLTALADSLDLTAFWQALNNTNAAGTTATATTSKPGSTPSATPSVNPAEPAATTLPFQNFGATLRVGRFYLGEIALTNLLASLKIDGGKVRVETLEGNLNGAAVKGAATVDLGTPGYKYDVTLKTGEVPVAPLVNTFMPQSRGQYQGNLVIDSQLQGTGITYPSLQTNLSGNLGMVYTNANISLINGWAKTILTPVAAILQVPELLQSPLDALVVQQQIAKGSAASQPFTVFTPAFHANSQGTITLGSLLTNSTLNFPIDLALRRSVAEKAHLISVATSSNADFVVLPSFIQLRGTFASPKVEVQKLELAKLGLKTISGLPQFAGTKAGLALSSASGLLEGTTNVSQALQGLVGSNKLNSVLGTNAAAGSALNLLNNVLGSKGAGAGSLTNAAGSATNAAAAGALNLLNSVLGARGAGSGATTGAVNALTNSGAGGDRATTLATNLLNVLRSRATPPATTATNTPRK